VRPPVPLGDPNRPLPRRPYRDSAIFYAVLACLLVLVTVLTGGSILRGILVALACFVIATAWSWWRFRERERLQQEQK
jgi:hypothetical protein